MGRIERSVRIDAPVETVYEYATDIRRFPEWWPSLVEVTRSSHERAAKGGTYEWSYRMMGLTFRGKEEFFDVVPCKMWRNGMEGGAFPHVFTHRLEAAGGGTLYTLVIEYTPPGGLLGKIADRAFLARYHGQEGDRVVANLKAICEALARGARQAEARRAPPPPAEPSKER